MFIRLGFFFDEEMFFSDFSKGFHPDFQVVFTCKFLACFIELFFSTLKGVFEGAEEVDLILLFLEALTELVVVPSSERIFSFFLSGLWASRLG